MDRRGPLSPRRSWASAQLAGPEDVADLVDDAAVGVDVGLQHPHAVDGDIARLRRARTLASEALSVCTSVGLVGTAAAGMRAPTTW